MIGVKDRGDRVAGDCARHRPDLLALLEGPVGVDLPPAARRHLDMCDACHSDLTGVLLMDVAVRRTVAGARNAAPADDAWPRLRARLERMHRAPRPGRAASPIAGLGLAVGLAVAMLLPIGVPVSSPHSMHEAGVDPAAIRAAGHRDAEDEARQLRATVLAGKEASSDDDIGRAREALMRQELAPVAEWRRPSRSPLINSAR